MLQSVRGARLVFVLVCGLALPASGDGVYERLKSFGFPDQLGQRPMAALVRGGDGKLYGTASAGGLANGSGGGVVFRVNEDGTGYTLLHVFNSTTNARSPQAPLLLGSNGALYGTTTSGTGAQKSGVVFKVDGGGYTELHAFGGTNDGSAPRSGLVKGADGALYGTTYSTAAAGLVNNSGTVYKIQEDGSGYQVLHQFTGGTNGANVSASLLADGTGALYGATEAGGTTNRISHGTLFRINEDGSGFTTLLVFSGTNGSSPRTSLGRAPDGSFFGVTRQGGSTNRGVVFRIHPNGTGFSVLHHFTNAPGDGYWPVSTPVLGPDGLLYGATAGGGTNSSGVLYRLGLDGNHYEVITQLPPAPGQNETFTSSLLLGTDGQWRGMTSGGGGENLGTIFRVNPIGADFTVLRHFSTKGGDARGPAAALVRAGDGYFYGTAPGGGFAGAGAVFRFAEGGLNYALVHSFHTNEGSAPNNLIEALPGVLFGTTASGGQFNKGTVFRLDTSGSNFTVLQHFAAGGQGERPLAGLLLANDGMLYGTTTRGGAIGFGALYRLHPDGTGFQVIHSFCCGTGYTPICSLVQGTNHALYGTTDDGGSFGRGVIFRVNTDGSDYQVLHDFTDDASDGGGFPLSGFTLGPDGKLYGSTGGAGGHSGVVFRLNQDGSEYTTLHAFTGTDGVRPVSPLIIGADNVLYGATQFGGTFGGQGGTVFRLNLDGSAFAVLHSFAFPVGPQGARPTGGLCPGNDGWLYGVTPLGGDFSDGVIYRVHPTATTNYPPALMTALGDHEIFILSSVNYSVSAGIFFDRDWGQTLIWTATGIPAGVTFDPATLTFSGVPLAPGSYDITVTATDNGVPPAFNSDTFQLRVLLPDIGIGRSGTNILVDWSENAIGFELQETDSPGPNAAWTSLGLPGGYYIGDRLYVVRPLKPGKWFYRLAPR